MINDAPYNVDVDIVQIKMHIHTITKVKLDLYLYPWIQELTEPNMSQFQTVQDVFFNFLKCLYSSYFVLKVGNVQHFAH